MLLASLLLTAVGCRSHSAPTTTIPEAELTPQACLEELDLNNLDQALQRCNQIVAAHENNPAPSQIVLCCTPCWARWIRPAWMWTKRSVSSNVRAPRLIR